LIAFSRRVASSSDCPPERKTIPGTAAGTCRAEATDRLVYDLLVGRLLGRVVAGEHHVRFQQDPFGVHSLVAQLGEDRVQRVRRDLEAPLDRVLAVHEHFRLHDRDEAGFLAERGIAGERVRICPDAVLARDVLADR